MLKSISPQSLSFHALIETHRDQFFEVLDRYGAENPRIFGSVARGDAGTDSDLDVIVDLPGEGNPLLRIAGLSEEFSELLGIRVDVVTDSLLRREVSESARREATRI